MKTYTATFIYGNGAQYGVNVPANSLEHAFKLFNKDQLPGVEHEDVSWTPAEDGEPFNVVIVYSDRNTLNIVKYRMQVVNPWEYFDVQIFGENELYDWNNSEEGVHFTKIAPDADETDPEGFHLHHIYELAEKYARWLVWNVEGDRDVFENTEIRVYDLQGMCVFTQPIQDFDLGLVMSGHIEHVAT